MKKRILLCMGRTKSHYFVSLGNNQTCFFELAGISPLVEEMVAENQKTVQKNMWLVKERLEESKSST
jgi:hypothetical protein